MKTEIEQAVNMTNAFNSALEALLNRALVEYDLKPSQACLTYINETFDEKGRAYYVTRKMRGKDRIGPRLSLVMRFRCDIDKIEITYQDDLRGLHSLPFQEIPYDKPKKVNLKW